MLRNQTTDLLREGRITTTLTRAKETRRMAEKMITLGKEKDLASYRQMLFVSAVFFAGVLSLVCEIPLFHLEIMLLITKPDAFFEQPQL